jgi:hypothetical protein
VCGLSAARAGVKRLEGVWGAEVRIPRGRDQWSPTLGKERQGQGRPRIHLEEIFVLQNVLYRTLTLRHEILDCLPCSQPNA